MTSHHGPGAALRKREYIHVRADESVSSAPGAERAGRRVCALLRLQSVWPRPPVQQSEAPEDLAVVKALPRPGESFGPGIRESLETLCERSHGVAQSLSVPVVRRRH